MKGVIVKFDAPNVKINGHTFECLLPAIELHAKIRGYMVNIARMNAHDEDQIRAIIAQGCDIIDDIFGAGAMARITSGQPVSLNAVLRVLNAAAEAMNEAYNEYLKSEYGGGR